MLPDMTDMRKQAPTQFMSDYEQINFVRFFRNASPYIEVGAWRCLRPPARPGPS